MASSASLAGDPLVQAVAAFVEDYMANHDPSHDFHHIRRVVGLAQHLAAAQAADPLSPSQLPLDLRIVTLAALLHDVGDRKYLPADQDDDGGTAALVRTTLLALGAAPALAAAVQAICAAVSWSREQADPGAAAAVLARHPELAVVQDADRLDALGAVGAGRAFAYGAAMTRGPARSLQGTLAHFDDKLLRIEGSMKTRAGREMARERTRRLEVFQAWFEEEAALMWEGAPSGDVVGTGGPRAELGGKEGGGGRDGSRVEPPTA